MRSRRSSSPQGAKACNSKYSKYKKVDPQRFHDYQLLKYKLDNNKSKCGFVFSVGILLFKKWSNFIRKTAEDQQHGAAFAKFMQVWLTNKDALVTI